MITDRLSNGLFIFRTHVAGGNVIFVRQGFRHDDADGRMKSLFCQLNLRINELFRPLKLADHLIDFTAPRFQKVDESLGRTMIHMFLDILQRNPQIPQRHQHRKGFDLGVGIIPVAMFIGDGRLENADVIVMKQSLFFYAADLCKLSGGEVVFTVFHDAASPVCFFLIIARRFLGCQFSQDSCIMYMR